MSATEKQTDNDRTQTEKQNRARRINGMPSSQVFLFYAPPSASWEQLADWWARLDKEGLV